MCTRIVYPHNSGTYRNCTILVHSRIATCDKQFWYTLEFDNSGAYQNWGIEVVKYKMTQLWYTYLTRIATKILVHVCNKIQTEIYCIDSVRLGLRYMTLSTRL